MPISTQPQDGDIERANKAWTEADVASSAQALAREHSPAASNDEAIMTPQIACNPSESRVIVELDKGIRKFWQKYRFRWVVVWVGMNEEAKRRLILTIAPEMAKTKNDKQCAGQLLLLPEMVVADLVADTEPMMNIIANIIRKDLVTQYLEDTLMIRNLVREGKIEPDQSKSGAIALLSGGDHPGQIMQINASKTQKHMHEVKESFDKMISTGLAIEGPIFSHVLMRRHHLLMTLALFFDEIRNEVFQVKSTKRNKIMMRTLKCSNPTCEATEADGGGALKQCSRCLIVQYCSRSCQKKPWQEHKKSCTKKSA